jgi:hypothetical protein
VVERRRLSVYFLYLAWRLWKSVVTLAVTGNTISGRVVRRQRVNLDIMVASIAVDRKSMGHTVGERWWKDADFLCIYVFSVAVMETCCDACGDEEYYFRSGCSASEGAGVSVAIECRWPEVDGSYGG